MKKIDAKTVILVTGLSGAGMSTALKSMEDLGYEVMDNLPLALVQPAIDTQNDSDQPLAIGIDCRTRGFDAHKINDLMHRLQNDQHRDVRLLMITCTDLVLQHRFSETRRRHPLALDRSVADGISKERELLHPLKDTAYDVIDTTEFAAHDLRRLLAGKYAPDQAHGLMVFVTSFGFKNGVPRDADMVFDVRFLWNPHYDEKLRPLTGKDKEIRLRLERETNMVAFFENLTRMLNDLLPLYHAEGKSYLTISMGCTGGRHRSVFMAEKLYAWLTDQGFSVGIKHRDLDRWAIEQQEKSKLQKNNIETENERKTS